jgi:hypothetical protein
MDIQSLENELKKRLAYPYKWGMKQNDVYDSKTNFIYTTFSFDELLSQIDSCFKGEENYQTYFNYALNRYYNFWSAQGIEKIFTSCPGVLPAMNSKDRLVDFTINGVTFDHKTSVYPAGYGIPFNEAKKKPNQLIKWLYDNQSRERRYHLRNRLFIVLYSSRSGHWKMKCELLVLKNIIEEYVRTFDQKNLFTFSFEEGKITLSDIIWMTE